MITERRKGMRRQSDRDLLDRLQSVQRARQGDSEDEGAASELRRIRRRAIRHNCEVRLSLVMSHRAGMGDVWSASEHPVKGRILDLSVEGCSVFTQNPIEIGQQLSLMLRLLDGRQIGTRGIARWTKGVPQKGGYAVGVQFETLCEKDVKAVRAFLKEMDDTVGL